MAESYANLLPDTLANVSQGQKFVDQQFDRANQMEAGRAYANGDRQGAGKILAQRGDIRSAMAIENNEIEKFKEQYNFIQQKALPFLSSAVQQGAPAVEAFDLLVPDLKRMGTDDSYIASLRQGFQADPQGMLKTLGVLSQVKPRFEKSGQNIIIFDENTGQEIGRVDAVPDPNADLDRRYKEAQIQYMTAGVPLREAQAQRAARPPAARQSSAPKPPAGFILDQ